jgi:hypothetical protein
MINGIEYTDDYSFYITNSVSIVENWNYTSTNSLVSPVIADINSDGYLEVIFGDINAADSKSLFCLDYTGNLLWDYDSDGAVWDSPTVADLNKDNEFEILFGLSRGTYSLVCLHSDGSVNWAVSGLGYINWMPVVADINLDGYQEVIVTNTNNIVFCYDYTGTQIWNNTASFNLYGGVAIGDLHDDFGLEIVFGYSGNTIYCLNSTGDTIQSYNNGDNLGCVPIIADLNNTGSYQTLYQSNGYFRCLDNNFNLKWQYDNNLQHGIYSVPSAADINNDNLFEVIIMNTYTDFTYPYLCSLNSTGHEQWKYNITGDYGSSAVIGDIENDDIVDIIFADNLGHIYCLDGQGSVNWIHNISYTPPSGIEFLNSPTLGDIDGDNVTELLILDDKTLSCFDFQDVISSGVLQWGCLKGSMFHTGQMDRDGDFLDDVNEQFYGTLIADWDTDDDLISDGREVFFGCDPLDPFDPFAIASPTPTSPTPTSTSEVDINLIITSSLAILSLSAIIVVRFSKRRNK